MSKSKYLTAAGKRFFLPAIFLCLVFFTSSSESAEVIVIGDTGLKPVVDIISGIRETIASNLKVYSPSDVKDRLKGIATEEESKVVIALGREAMKDALQLPSSIPVIYDLVITPLATRRPNTTGFYMATPVKEYMSVIRKYLPSIRNVAVIGSPDLIRTLEGPGLPQVTVYKVNSPFEYVETIKRLDSTDAILLLPDIALLTETVINEVYLLSFKRHIPILGVSEKYVKNGALFSLVFDSQNVGRHIGEKANMAVSGKDMDYFPPSPPEKFDLYINKDTAKEMGIFIPDELLRKAKRIYP